MLKDRKNLIISICFLLLLAIILFLGIEKIGEIKPPPPLAKEYSFKDVIYNFWGFVTEKGEDSVSVEGIIPEPGKITVNQPLQTIKFEITDKTKIAKIDKEGNQTFVSPETIQIKDHLALKADRIDTIRKEAVATDILILPSLPSPPLPPEGETSPKI